MVKRIFFTLFIIVLFLNFISASSPVHLVRNNIWSLNLSAVLHSSLVFGDIDGDGQQDLIAMGCTAGGVDTCTTTDKIRVYINNRTTFNENLTWESNTTNLGYGSLALGDINNDGKLDLIALGDKGGGSGAVKIYLNNGTTFNEDLTWEQNLSNINAYAGSIALGDVNNDGKLDLALVGASPSDNNGIYLNNGTGFVKDTSWITSLPLVGHGLGMGAIIFGDVNNDGKLDMIFVGSWSTNLYSKVYINNGINLIENSIWKGDLPVFGWPSLALGDYDNDEYIDLAFMGVGDYLNLYKNNQTTFLINQTNIGAFFDGSVTLGDYNNDGYLDLAAIGKESGRDAIYTNNKTLFGRDIFEQQDMRDDNMQQGSLSWIDVNGDNNLDLIINGRIGDTSNSNFTVYISNASLTKNNTLPTPPSILISSYSSANNTLTLGWNNGSDNETPSTGLYYNLMVGNSTTNHTIVSGVYGGSSNPTAGYFGNMMQRKNITLNLALPAGTYYWYVQTIDTGLAKSAWSERQSFTVGVDTTPPNITSISSSVTSSTAIIIWTTEEMANSTVYYGTTVSTGSKSSSASLTQSHSVILNGLSDSTLYYYNVSSCDYSGNCNNSIQYNFTTSAAGSGNVNPGGNTGATSPFWTNTIVISNENIILGSEKELGKGQRVKFNISGEEHYIGIININSSLGEATINISSNPLQIILRIGEEIKINVSNSNFYDVYIRLNNISNLKANLTIHAINEQIPGSNGNQTIENNANTNAGKIINTNTTLFWVIVSVIALAIILIITKIFFYFKRKKKW